MDTHRTPHAHTHKRHLQCSENPSQGRCTGSLHDRVPVLLHDRVNVLHLQPGQRTINGHNKTTISRKQAHVSVVIHRRMVQRSGINGKRDETHERKRHKKSTHTSCSAKLLSGCRRQTPPPNKDENKKKHIYSCAYYAFRSRDIFAEHGQQQK